MENGFDSTNCITDEDIEFLKSQFDLMKYATARQDVIDRVYDICRLSPEHGNAVSDIFGDVAYNYIIRSASDEHKKSAT